MNFSAVSSACQDPHFVSIRPTEASGSLAMFATGEQWSGVDTIHEVLQEEDCQRVGNKTFLVDRFSCVANFRCENSGQCEKRT